MYGAKQETCEAFYVSLNTANKIVERGKVQPSKRGKRQTKQKFSKIDTFWKDLIRDTIYGFYLKKVPPTLDTLLAKLQEISLDTNYQFPYGRTTLYKIIKKLAFKYKKADNRKVIMESPRLVAWRYEYPMKIKKYRLENFLICYLHELWFDSHNTTRMLWSDDGTRCSVSAPPSRGKRMVFCHAGTEGFVPNSLLLCKKSYQNPMLIIMMM